MYHHESSHIKRWQRQGLDLAFTTAKQLIPVANKPILGYALDHSAQTGIKEVGIIMMPPEIEQDVKNYVKDDIAWHKLNLPASVHLDLHRI
jgi:dTDP-glucose pyrophosphorylase